MLSGSSDRSLRLVRLALIVATIVLVVVTVVRSTSTWRKDANLNHVAGAMVTLSLDLTDGVLYRPLVGERGFGGTRYFPLFFTIHAALIGLWGNPVLTGYGLSAISTLFLLCGIFFLLCELEVDKVLSLILAASVLASWPTQHALTTIQGDVLPAALNVWGIALCARPDARLGRVTGSAILFSLAFAAKITTLFGAAAVFFYLLLSGRRRDTLFFVSATAAGCLLVLFSMHGFSAGRAFPILNMTATGGATLWTFAKSPLNMIYQILVADPADLTFLVAGLAAFLACFTRAFRGIAALSYLFTFLATIVIFGSPGTSINHLLDLHVASVVLLGVWAKGQNAQAARFVFITLAVGIVISLRVLILGFPHYEEMKPRGQWYARVAQIVGRTDKPILSEDPFVPIVHGERPYLADPFTLRLSREQDPSVTEKLREDFRKRKYSAVVLFHDPGTPFGRNFLTNIHFGKGFLEMLFEEYRFHDQVGDFRIYTPKADRSGDFRSGHL